MIRRLMILSGALGLAALVGYAQVTPPTPTPPPRTIYVTGTAERMVSPDTGIAVVAIQTRAETVSRAVQQNNTIATRVRDAITRLNIARLTIRTLGFDVQPVYEQRPPTSTTPPRIVAYQVINRLEVRITNTNPEQLADAVSRVLDAALTAGANRVDEVRFTLEDERPVMRELVAEAMNDARSTAMVIAAAANVQLGTPLSISVTPYYQPPQPLYAARAAQADAASVPIEAGLLLVRATVSVTYEILRP